jgi:hypothetical protein
MGYQSRQRKYTSRRERYQRDMRNIRIILIFLVLGLAVWALRNRHDWIAYWKTYFY